MKYYYVVLASEWDLYKISYSDIDKCKDAEYIAGLSSIYGVRLAKYLNSVIIRINIPFGWILLLPLYWRLRKIKRPICFIFFGNWVEYEISLGFMNMAKKMFSNSRYVWFLQDLVNTHPRVKNRMPDFMNNFDLTLSFDYKDCQIYNMLYHPLVFSSLNLTDSVLPKSDVYFLGKAKNRISEIIKAYEYLKSKGLKADFYLVDVPSEKQIYKGEIHYIKGMSYMENLKHVCGSKCVLEIMQKGGTGFTLRVNEVLYFNKKLITNNRYLLNAPFYDNNNMSVIDDTLTFNDSFVDRIKQNAPTDYNYKEKLSPLKLLQFVEYKLL